MPRVLLLSRSPHEKRWSEQAALVRQSPGRYSEKQDGDGHSLLCALEVRISFVSDSSILSRIEKVKTFGIGAYCLLVLRVGRGVSFPHYKEFRLCVFYKVLPSKYMASTLALILKCTLFLT